MDALSKQVYPTPPKPSSGRSRRITKLHYVLLMIAGTRCAIRADQIVEVLPVAKTYRPLGSPAILMGLLNIAGEPLPVISGERLIEAKPTADDLYTPLIVLNANGTKFVLRANTVDRITAVTPDQIDAIPDGHVFNNCATSAIRVDHEIICVLEPDRLLLESESKRLADLQAAERERLVGLEAAG